MSIVTTHYRYKRPPRKRKRVVLTGSAIVTPPKRKAKAHTPAAEPQASGSAIVRRAKAGNDNRSAERPSAFLARMVRPGGSLPPDASE
jgi:hypothetical protein